MFVLFNKEVVYSTQKCLTTTQLQTTITNLLQFDDFYLTSNGKKLLEGDTISENARVHINLRLCGGKGGFGSMLRAIGAQIEKTTNREACRDLSGRRLRDINEEQRLKTWISQQADREKQQKDQKRKKLEKMLETPKHEFKDESYYKEREELSEKVEDAVICGMKNAQSSNLGLNKRKNAEESGELKSKKTKLWIDDDLDEVELSSSDEDSDENEEKDKKSCEMEQSEDNTAEKSCEDEKHNQKDDENEQENVDKDQRSCEVEKCGDNEKEKNCEDEKNIQKVNKDT